VIHPFANGNGRHSRFMADLLVEKLGRPSFTWGGASLADEGALRARYIAALRSADNHEIEPLLAFARS
jgi:fido (protein-threonine AMPylation protein)